MATRTGTPLIFSALIAAATLSSRAEEAVPDAGGIITWQVHLAPGEKKEFRVQYSIEAPSELSVGGLE